MTNLLVNERHYWLWVTRPEFYCNEDGTDKEELDPKTNPDVGGFYWTCSKKTKRGDLAFLWRTTPKKDIGYLMQVESDSYSLAEDEYAVSRRWEWGCASRVLYKFENPVTIQDLRQDPYLNQWKPLKARFQSRAPAFLILAGDWERINLLADKKNPGYADFLRRIESMVVNETSRTEKELQEALCKNLGKLKPFGYDLELYTDPQTGRNGYEWVCKGQHRGRIDLLCYDRRQQRFVVIELKDVPASQNTFGQISSYVGWVQANLSSRRFILPGKPPIGLVISRGFDAKFEASLKITDRIKQLNISDLGFD